MYLDIFCAIPRLAFVEPQIILLAPEVYQYHIYWISTQYLPLVGLVLGVAAAAVPPEHRPQPRHQLRLLRLGLCVRRVRRVGQAAGEGAQTVAAPQRPEETRVRPGRASSCAHQWRVLRGWRAQVSGMCGVCSSPASDTWHAHSAMQHVSSARRGPRFRSV